MKRIIKFFALSFSFLVLSGLGFLTGIYYQNIKQKPLAEYKEEYYYKEPFSQKEIKEASAIPDITTFETKYQVISYDITTEEESSELLPIPEDLIGKTREEIEAILDARANTYSLSEREKGYKYSRLDWFSPEEIRIWRLYQSKPELDSFYLTEENGILVIYHEKDDSLYMHTGILVDSLPTMTQEEIRNGKVISTVEELYYFLESHTS